MATPLSPPSSPAPTAAASPPQPSSPPLPTSTATPPASLSASLPQLSSSTLLRSSDAPPLSTLLASDAAPSPTLLTPSDAPPSTLLPDPPLAALSDVSSPPTLLAASTSRPALSDPPSTSLPASSAPPTLLDAASTSTSISTALPSASSPLPPTSVSCESTSGEHSLDSAEAANTGAILGVAVEELGPRERTVREILETERAYVASLSLARKYFLLPLRAGAVAEFNKEDTFSVFGNLEQLLELNSYFLSLVEERVRGWSETSTLGDVFLKAAPLFRLYCEYLRNYGDAIRAVAELAHSAPAFAAFLKTTQRDNRETLRMLGLHDLLIKPVQRLPRYVLLLRTLGKHTPAEHPDRQYAQQAADAIVAVTSQANESIRMADELAKVLDVLHRFRKGRKKMPVLLQPGRLYIDQFKLNKITAHGVRYRVRFFLFSDLLVYGEKLATAPHFLRYKGAIPLATSWTKDLPDMDSVQNLFQIVAPAKTYTLYADTPELKTRWLGLIAGQIQQLVARDPKLLNDRAVVHVNQPSHWWTAWDSRLNILRENAGDVPEEFVDLHRKKKKKEKKEKTTTTTTTGGDVEQPPAQPEQPWTQRMRQSVVDCWQQPAPAYRLLWVSHAIGQWSNRLWDFAVPLVLAVYFPTSLLPATLFPFTTCLVSLLAGPLVGRWVDKHGRWFVVCSTSICQNLAVPVACLFLWLLGSLTSSALLVPVYLLMLVFGVFSDLCSLANSIAVTKDWCVVVARHDGVPIGELNAVMKRIDLICGIMAPLFFGLLQDQTTSTAPGIAFVGLWCLASVVPQVLLQKLVYGRVPALHVQSEDDGAPPKENPFRVLARGWKEYTSHLIFGPSFAYVLLFVTVLSGGVQVSAYLVTQRISTTVIAVFRGGVSLFGVLSTFVVVPAASLLGNIRAGQLFLFAQLLALTGSAAAFFYAEYYASTTGYYLFLVGIMLSRVGLWGFDLIEVQLIQLVVEEQRRGIINGTEYSLTQLAWLTILGLGLILNSPSQFGWLVMISVDFVALASLVYLWWWRKPMQGANDLQDQSLSPDDIE